VVEFVAGAGAGVADGILLVSRHLFTNELVDNLPGLGSLDLSAMLESGVSEIGVNGVPALVKPSSKIIEVVEDELELELDVEDVVAHFKRNGVLRGGLLNAL
jgi:hypothetical protein